MQKNKKNYTHLSYQIMLFFSLTLQGFVFHSTEFLQPQGKETRKKANSVSNRRSKVRMHYLRTCENIKLVIKKGKNKQQPHAATMVIMSVMVRLASFHTPVTQ